MVTTVVFDIGNVVWRFRPVFDCVFTKWAKLMGISLRQFRLNYYEKDHLYCKFETDELKLTSWLTEICPDVPPKKFLDIAADIFGNDHYFAKYFNQNILKLILSIRQSGIPVGCLSNTENFFYPYLKKNILHNFDYQILSWQVGLRKPDPRIFHEIYKYGKFLPSEILFIDDIAINIAAAKKQGINGILYRNESQLIWDIKKYKL